MRKIVLLFFVLLFMAMPAMATSNVTLSCTHTVVGDTNWIAVSWASTGTPDANRIRAFGLDIRVFGPDGNTTDPNIMDVCDVNSNYRIYPGRISILPNGDVNSYKTCYDPCDLADHNNFIAVEMGSLYTTDYNYHNDANAGYNMIPGLTGLLLRYAYKNGCYTRVDANTLRGGIVMEDPYDTLTLSSPLCDFNGCAPAVTYKDWGDAPDTYSTLLASNGPNHLMNGTTAGKNPILGSLIDAEADASPPLNTRGDDTTNLADEDGVSAWTAVWGSPGSVTVTVSGANGYLNAFVDFNNNGVFDVPGVEQIFTNTPVSCGVAGAPLPNVLAFAIPAGATLNTDLVSRFRVTSYTLPAGKFNGAATDGEVEDYNKPKITCPNTPPNAATNPNPANNAVDVNLYRDLIWTKGTGARSHNVYYGTTNPPPFKVNQTSVTYDTGTAQDSNHVVYYWRIDEVNGCATTTGTVWNFTTNLDCLNSAATTTAHWADWKLFGKPTCWCYVKQCRGDTNGKKTSGSWVATNDFTLFKSAYLVPDANLQPGGSHYPWGICADLNHKKTSGSRVATNDFTIFKTYYLQPDINVPDCNANWDGTDGNDFRWWATPP